FFFSSRRRHTRSKRDWSSDVCSSDLYIRIWFMFRGKRCRETLKGWEITNSNIKKAGNLRALIVHEINSGEFEYLRRFPQSSTGRSEERRVGKECRSRW